MIKHGIELDSQAVRDFCKKWRLRELSVFGSVLRDDFGPDSDVDFLFTLEDRLSLSLDAWISMEDELSALINHRVDLVPRHSIEESENYIRRRNILKSLETVYDAG